MRFDMEIERAVRHLAATDIPTTKTQYELDLIVEKVKSDVKNKNYDFSSASSLVLTQHGKKRFVKLYEDSYSTESILCQCIKQIFDRNFKIKYPNRNNTIKSLFTTLSAAKQMSEFTIVRFDFKDYFNSVSAIYVFKKYLKPELTDRFEIDLINDFVKKTKYAYAGLKTSNAIAEIIARQFDSSIRNAFLSYGLLYFERYVDDSIMILNQNVGEAEIKCILQKVLSDVFFDDTVNVDTKCKTKFNDSKFCFISRRNIGSSPYVIDYLGYEFRFSLNSKRIELKYGITTAKREKYNKRIEQLISCFVNSNHKDYGNLELLRHRIAAFTSRTVYLNKRFRANVWKTKGFILNYGELRYLLETDLIHEDTKLFLKNMVDEAFNRAGVPKPYFVLGAQSGPGYNLFENMKVNKTILLVEHIGYEYNALIKLCNQVGISTTDANGKRRGYGTLVRDYLIKVKVGY